MSKTKFNGFPVRPEVTPLPNIFFSEVLPGIDNLAELKVVMQIFFMLSRRKGYPRFVTFKELSNDGLIIKGMRNLAPVTDELLKQALESAVMHRILISVPVNVGDQPDNAYFINNLAEQETIAKVAEGVLKIPNIAVRNEPEPIVEQPSDIYNLYEQNIGMLTPIMAEELQEAEHRYPNDWIQDAFREAIRANVRNWKYIHSILKRWEREGKKDGKSIRDSRKERDTDKYLRGKHGHVVRG